MAAQRFEHLDADRPDGRVHPVIAELPGGADDSVLLVVEDDDERVLDAEVRVLTHAGDQEQLVGRPVAVEVIAVVEVAITGDHVTHRQRGLVDGVVVEGRQHGSGA